MKTIKLLVLFALCSLFAQGQTVLFEHDAAGNLTSKTVIRFKSTEALADTLFQENISITLENNLLKLGPNPNNGCFTLEIPYLQPSGAEANLYNLNGTKILEKHINNEFTTFNITELAKGVYVLELIISNKKQTIKLQIQ